MATCEKKCNPKLMLYGAILNSCWVCFQNHIQKNPECIHHFLSLPQREIKSEEKYSISDKDGNIIYEPKQKYVRQTMIDVLLDELDIECTDFTYKALKYMIQNNAARSIYEYNSLFCIYSNINNMGNANEERDDYTYKHLKLMSIALDHGWYEPARAITTCGSVKEDNNMWRAYLIEIMWVTDTPIQFDFRKLVWQFLEKGEFLEDVYTPQPEDINFPYFKIEEKMKEMGLDSSNLSLLSLEEYEAIEKAIWLEYEEKMKVYISEYYSQEYMKQSE